MLHWAIGMAACLAFAGQGDAAQTVFTTRSAFNAAAGSGLTFESFETQRNGQTVAYPGVSVSETAGSFNLIVHTSNNATFTAATTHLGNSIWFSDNGPSVATFSFATPITAFGIDTAFSQARTVTFGGGVNGSLALAANTPGFFGVISDTAFSNVTVNVDGNPNVGFDALAFGLAAAPVPEPAQWALLIGGFGIVGAAARRRRSHAAPLALLALAASLPNAASAAIITNGGFEADPVIATGWQSSGDASVRSAGSNLAVDGTQVGVMGVGISPFAAASGSVFQEFTLAQSGRLNYDFKAGTIFFGGFGFAVGFVFRIDDQVISNAPPTFVSDSVNFSYYPLSTQIAGGVDLSAGTHRFAFDISRSETGFGRGVAFVIDDVQTTFSPAAGGVPEPAQWALLIGGFGIVGAAARRRNKQNLAVA